MHRTSNKKRPPGKAASVIPTRFERVTHSLEGCCSIQLSYGTILNGTAKLVIFPLIANVEGLYCTKLAK